MLGIFRSARPRRAATVPPNATTVADAEAPPDGGGGITGQPQGATRILAADAPSGQRGAATLFAPGTRFGSYTITHFLCRGGMALIYAGIDGDGITVALKVMRETPFLPADMLERFRREAEATKRLRRHPGIVTVYETGLIGDTHYIAMELVPGGRSLATLLESGPLSIPETLRLAVAVGKALAYAHANGIVHRDLKPGNVLINEFGEPLLADFGLASLADADRKALTLSAVAMGTPRYMSPEQTVSTRRTTALTDLYSFGVLLYEMLTDRSPYGLAQTASAPEVFEAIRHRQPVPVRRARREIPRDLAAVVGRLLEKAPEARYASMADVVADLQACREGRRVSVRTPNVFERFDRIMRAHKLVSAVTTVGVLAVVGVYRWQTKVLLDEREARLLPHAESASRSGELRILKRAVAGDLAEAPGERLLDEAYRRIVEAGDLPAARRILLSLIEQGNRAQPEPERGLVRTGTWELARLHLAMGEFEAARTGFRHLADEDGMPAPLTALAGFEEGVACHLAGEVDHARRIWQSVLLQVEPNSNMALLCRGALGHMAPDALCERVEADLPLVRALGLWLAAEHTEAAGTRAARRRQAATAARSVLPWLYYHLTYGSVHPPFGGTAGGGADHPAAAEGERSTEP